MTDYNDGEWHLWNSRHRPDGVHPKSLVTHIWHDENTGKCGMNEDAKAGSRAWSQTLKFRVTKPFQEPRVIWVNEYPGGKYYAYDSEMHAIMLSDRDSIRIAVRYVEAPE